MRRLTPDTPPTATADGDLLTVEARTAADAVAEVHERLGDDARIVHAEKVLRGGMWGFFPRQVVQLQARPTGPTPRGTDPTMTHSGTAEAEVSERIVPRRAADDWERPRGLAGVLADLSSQHDDAEEGLGAALRRHLGVQLEEERDALMAAETRVPPAPAAVNGTPQHGHPPVMPAPAVPPAAVATVSPAAPLQPGAQPLGRVGHWSARGLLKLGLPRGLVDTVLAQQPDDDAAWTHAVARALGPLCRPLPAGPSLWVGPRAAGLARLMNVPLVDASTASPELDRCAVEGPVDPVLLDTPRGRRWVHVVVGGPGWRRFLADDPPALSWAGDDALGEAIFTAHELGMVLGPGARRRSRVVQPNPVDLAMLVRERLVDAA